MYSKNPSCPFCRRAFGLPIPDVNKELVALVDSYLQKRSVGDAMDVAEFEQDSILFHIPEEVLVDILSFLPPKQIGKTSRVCKDMKRVADDAWLWREICQSSFPFCSVDRVTHLNTSSESGSTERIGNGLTLGDQTSPKAGKREKLEILSSTR